MYSPHFPTPRVTRIVATTSSCSNPLTATLLGLPSHSQETNYPQTLATSSNFPNLSQTTLPHSEGEVCAILPSTQSLTFPTIIKRQCSRELPESVFNLSASKTSPQRQAVSTLAKPAWSLALIKADSRGSWGSGNRKPKINKCLISSFTWQIPTDSSTSTATQT